MVRIQNSTPNHHQDTKEPVSKSTSRALFLVNTVLLPFAPRARFDGAGRGAPGDFGKFGFPYWIHLLLGHSTNSLASLLVASDPGKLIAVWSVTK